MSEQTAIDYLRYVVKGFVSHADDVVVDETLDEMGVLLTLSVNKEDMGRVIGREGRNAEAIRVLVRMVGKTKEQHVSVKISEPESDVIDRPKQEYKNEVNEVLEDITI